MSDRPKGYIDDWRPRPEVALVIEQTQGILQEYGAYGPMTVRQIFYRLVGQHGYEKTERAYKRLAEWLVRARRARIIRFDKIRDDGGTTQGGPSGWTDLDAFLGDLAEWSTSFDLDKTIGQPNHIELWCEAEGMVPMLAQMVAPWNVRVTGSGGFSSVTVTHGFANRVVSRYREDGRPTILLHVGDRDPSGESIFTSMAADIGAFVSSRVGGYLYTSGEVEDRDERRLFVPRRVALTEDQVNEYDLPSAPPKSSDSRSASWIGDTTQLEAMAPNELEEVVTAALAEWIDQDKIDALVEQEEEERELVGSRVKDAIDTIRDELENEDDR